MAELSVDQFQCIVSRTDPRAVLVFSSAFDEVFPFIAATSVEVGCSVTTVPQNGSLVEVFTDCLNSGGWLVVEDIRSASFDEWREVGARLVTLLPNATFHSRKTFRLFTFVNSENPNLRLYAPQILCQFAVVVSHDGSLSCRSDLSPIFLSDTSFETSDSFGPLCNTAPMQNRNAPYEGQSSIRRRVAAALDARVAATHIDFIDETLCALREELEERQKHLLDCVEPEVEKRLCEFKEARHNEKLFFANEGSEAVVIENKRQEIRREKVHDVEQSYDWIFPKIVEWCVCQCPEVDVVGATEIPDIFGETVAWTTVSHEFASASWNGCPVLLKRPQETLSTVLRESLEAGLKKEAARHFVLRHPRVMQMFGLHKSAMVLEFAFGTLEQYLSSRRGLERCLTVSEALRIGKQVLEGLVFLAPRLVHRDIACRSVMQVGDFQFKIGQFQCSFPKGGSDTREASIPVRWSSPEALVGVFNEKSDIWSFGVLLWEMIQYCAVLPYGDHVQAANVISKGEVLPMPIGCPTIFWNEIVLPCFVLDSEGRGSAQLLLGRVDRALSKWDESILNGRIPIPDDNVSFSSFNCRA